MNGSPREEEAAEEESAAVVGMSLDSARSSSSSSASNNATVAALEATLAEVRFVWWHEVVRSIDRSINHLIVEEPNQFNPPPQCRLKRS